MDYHATSIENALNELKTSKQGLTKEEAEERLKKHGFNEIKAKKGISPVKIFLSQFKSPLVWILIAAIIVSFFVHKGPGIGTDTIVIGIVLLLNAILGFGQEFKAEKAIESLKHMEAVRAEVIRNNEKRLIDARELVTGDIIIIDEGEKIPADCRLIECYNLATTEAVLTGESRPVDKSLSALKAETAVADRLNMIFKGTMSIRGRAVAVVTSTGMHTEMGKIAHLIQEADEKKIPLNIQLARLGKWIGISVIVLCAVIFAVMMWKGDDVLSTALIAIALAVAAVPEGLPAVATISFALGVQKMAKKHALIRKLPSVETLGSTTVICTDKTGTLTMNEMTVRKMYCSREIINVSGAGYSAEGKLSAKPKGVEMLLKAGLLCNNAVLNEEGVIGDPTEAALLVSAAKAGISRQDADTEFQRADEIPFSSERKMMTTLHKNENTITAFAKGAPDTILSKCTKFLYNGRIRALTNTEKEQILDVNESLAKEALRVLGFAYKPFTKKEEAEEGMIFIGLQGMIDPPRKEAKAALQKCRDAGIHVVMITGDQKATAEAIASELGIKGRILTGADLDAMDKKKLASAAKDTAVYARVSPEHKTRIIEALKKNNHTVAMTGDGINDAPALKNADIGIAVGSGTDVAKESADMILLDDNFATIVNAVEEGRTIYDNIRKFTAYLLSCNLAEVLIVFFAVMIGMPLPFVALQILWINLVTDAFPALALGMDAAGTDIMHRKPRKAKEQIVSREVAVNISILAVIVAAIVLFVFWKYQGTEAQTIAFTLLVGLELVVPFIIRARYKVYSINYWLLAAVIVSALLQVAVIYTPLSKVFSTVALGIGHLMVIVIAAICFMIAGIFIELISRKIAEKG